MNFPFDLFHDDLAGLFNHLDGITVALCTSDYRILFLNRAFEKAAHLHSIPDDLSLHDYVDLDQERLSTISREKLVSFYNVVMKPDNRRYKVTILSAGDYRIFVGEQSDPNDTDMMSAMSALSNEANNIARELRRKNAELEQANLRIEELLRHDALTGLYNRRYLAEYLPRTIRLSKRNSSPLSLIICDIDHFKTINDTWGHDAGDTVLVDFSRVLSSVCRAEDIIVRYGGEEFIVVLEFTDVTAALSVSEKVRREIESSVNCNGKAVTASFGIAALLQDDSDKTLIARADKALYISKENGRNRSSAL